MHHILIQGDLKPGLEATGLWLSVIFKPQRAILTWKWWSNDGCPVVNVHACVALCRLRRVQPIRSQYEEIEYEKYHWTPVRRFDLQPFPKLFLSLGVLQGAFLNLYLAECFNYWAHEGDLELRFCLHARAILAGWHRFEMLAIPMLCCPIGYIESQAMGGS